ncbi:hypothetical protein [Chitinophaga caseinilytica]|uniref:hypothetical protein n=1 Tax=Chitinophaga caseinilytica TaxID=2267521 RepID=UPI003C2D45FE
MFADLDKRKPHAVYCLGDLVGYNIWLYEVIRAICKLNIPTIAGNNDQGIGPMSHECCGASIWRRRSDASNALKTPNPRKSQRNPP